MKTKFGENGYLAAGLIGLTPALEWGLKLDDFSAAASFLLWILLGLIVVKILAIVAGIS